MESRMLSRACHRCRRRNHQSGRKQRRLETQMQRIILRISNGWHDKIEQLSGVHIGFLIRQASDPHAVVTAV